MRQFLRAMIDRDDPDKVLETIFGAGSTKRKGMIVPGDAAIAAATARTPAQPADDAPHLLLVDDDRRIRDLLSRFLVRRRLSRHHRDERRATPAPSCSACISIC